MKVVAIIPSRMAATRFPGKPLTPICGMPMIRHVYERCVLALGKDSVWLATCDEAIQNAGKEFGAKVIMTSDQHVRCTDRIAEAARTIEADVIINVQGDEPVLDPKALEQVLQPFLKSRECLASNLVQRINPAIEDPRSYNRVKIVFNQKMKALYLSREPIPTPQKTPDVTRVFYKQIGLIAFRKDFLETFSRLAPTPLEAAESVDMLRMLEHGYSLDVVESESQFLAVDVPADVSIVEAALRKDPHFSKYVKS